MPGPVEYKIPRRADALRISRNLDEKHPGRLHRPVKSSSRSNASWRIEVIDPKTGESLGIVMI
jgi:hypothetical protein